MKKNVLILVLTIFGSFTIQSQTIDPPPHPTETICRCKYGGCFGGNAISFRARCGQSGVEPDGTVTLCSEFVSNCHNGDL